MLFWQRLYTKWKPAFNFFVLTQFQLSVPNYNLLCGATYFDLLAEAVLFLQVWCRTETTRNRYVFLCCAKTGFLQSQEELKMQCILNSQHLEYSEIVFYHSDVATLVLAVDEKLMANFTGRIGAHRDRLFWSVPISRGDSDQERHVPLVVLYQLPFQISIWIQESPSADFDGLEWKLNWPALGTQSWLSCWERRLHNGRSRSAARFTAAAAAWR